MTLSEVNKKALIWELSLSSDDVRSHGWYHGMIPRSRAEELLQKNGDFLVRERTSKPDDFVLSCRWRDGFLHFVMNKVVLQPHTIYEKTCYTFEDDFFDTVPDLITYCVGSRKQISSASGAVISRPINRLMPLSFYAEKYAKHNVAKHSSTGSLKRTERKLNRISSLENESKKVSTLPKNTKLAQNLQYNTFNDKVDKPPKLPPKQKNSLNPKSQNSKTVVYANSDVFDTLNNDPNLSPKHTENDKDMDKIVFGSDNPLFLDESLVLSLPLVISYLDTSKICLENFFTFLLPKENKPLDVGVVTKIHSVLSETGPRILANHATRIDLEFINHLNKPFNYGLSVQSSLELLTLPQGKQFRLDLIERHQAIKYFVATTVLTAREDAGRAKAIHKWIEIAFETKTALGNSFTFSAIMDALSMDQITRLRSTWAFLRQKHTDIAFIYETTLRPIMKEMHEGTDPQAPNTTFPYVSLLVQILQKHFEKIDTWELNDQKREKNKFNVS